MGPPVVFDKSFLQSLSVDESVLFDHFFIPVICPIFYVETLADLTKAVRHRRTPEQEVGIIARKVPEMSGTPCVLHTTMAIANLLGQSVPMTGQIPIAGGKPVKVDGKPGLIHEVSPEAEAFDRWQNGEFLEVEHRFARAWRTTINNIDLSTLAAGMRAMGVSPQNCKSLGEAREMSRAFLGQGDYVPDQIKLAFILLDAPRDLELFAVEKWRKGGAQALANYAPYAAHVMAVEVFFQIALGANLIGTGYISNRTDVAYLFYAPFCLLFVSSDNLHRRCAPNFLRSDQSFVWGPDLKADLRRLHQRYDALPEEQKEQGLMRLAPVPPIDDPGCLVSQLWDRSFGTSWRREPPTPPRDQSKDAELVQHLNRFSKAPPLSPNEVDFRPADVEMLQITRRIHKRKGSWWQLPKDLKG